MNVDLRSPTTDYRGTAAILYGSLQPAITDEAEEARLHRLEHLVTFLRGVGIGVLIGRDASAEDFFDVLAGESSDLTHQTLLALLWASDGADDEGIVAADGRILRPSDLPQRICPTLRLALFSRCETPRWAERWYSAIAQRLIEQSDNERVSPPTVLGWGGLASRGQLLGHYSRPESNEEDFQRIFDYLQNPVLMPTTTI